MTNTQTVYLPKRYLEGTIVRSGETPPTALHRAARPDVTATAVARSAAAPFSPEDQRVIDKAVNDAVLAERSKVRAEYAAGAEARTDEDVLARLARLKGKSLPAEAVAATAGFHQKRKQQKANTAEILRERVERNADSTLLADRLRALSGR